MPLLDKLERTFGRLAIPNISLYIVIGQVFVLFAAMLGRLELESLILVGAWVLDGEWWRVLTFIFIPPPVSGALGIVFVAFAWYLFYLMGSALEATWGAFRYNLFLLIGYALSVGVAFLFPGSPASNLFLAGSVFLAFAYLNPDFELALFFILPIKIKWLALITWVLYAVRFVQGRWSTRLEIIAAVANFLLFFGRDIVLSIRHRKRKMARQTERVQKEAEPRHICHVCGKTDLSHPQLDFRYCSKCAGDQCYCPEHIQNHAHVVAANEEKAG
ncbi:MAG: rhomboid family intramembrane serine protease [Opitutaceae bacterium]|nr:rhomboid family intramembrane serine protease [Opitutaceae bacterium]